LSFILKTDDDLRPAQLAQKINDLLPSLFLGRQQDAVGYRKVPHHTPK
jgi:hypothetical protein